MTKRVPDPTPTPDGPSYEGRPLDRPDEEVVDQGASFDLGTLMSRRALIGAGIVGVGALALAACTSRLSSSEATAAAPSPSLSESTDASSSTASEATGLPEAEIPDETAGPYPADGSNGPDALDLSGIVRSDLRSSIGADDPVDGVPLEFTFTVADMANGDAPFTGVAVYAWHCDAQGRYSMYSEGVEGETWLRGVQVADADGTVTFTSILPGCYAGRWTHIHFEVYPDLDSITDHTKAISTSQMAIPEDALTGAYQLPAYAGSAENLARITLETDNVFGEDSAALQTATMSGDLDGGYAAALTVRVDTTTEPTAGGMPGGGGAPGGAPGGQGGPGGEPPRNG